VTKVAIDATKPLGEEERFEQVSAPEGIRDKVQNKPRDVFRVANEGKG